MGSLPRPQSLLQKIKQRGADPSQLEVAENEAIVTLSSCSWIVGFMK